MHEIVRGHMPSCPHGSADYGPQCSFS